VKNPCHGLARMIVRCGLKGKDQGSPGHLRATAGALPLDRRVAEGRGGNLALCWLGKNGETHDISYRELFLQSCRFADMLRDLGVGKGERVFSLLGRVPELYVTALGTLRSGSVFWPLFSALVPSRCARTWQSGKQRRWLRPAHSISP
jgi:acyl-coenzyme A synthetase/AMP-(fatty) acid ligase